MSVGEDRGASVGAANRVGEGERTVGASSPNVQHESGARVNPLLLAERGGEVLRGAAQRGHLLRDTFFSICMSTVISGDADLGFGRRKLCSVYHV